MVEVVDRREGDDLDEVALEFFSSNGARRCESMRLSVLSEHRGYLVADLLMLLMTSGLNLASLFRSLVSFPSWSRVHISTSDQSVIFTDHVRHK